MRALWILAILMLVAWPAIAGTRVALLRIDSGSVSLNGRKVSTPQLIDDGATLVLERGARVRLQLMESQREVTLDGPTTMTVTQSELLKSAKAVKRDSLAASPDIGNTTRGAVNTTRKSRKIRGLTVLAEPTRRDSQWVFPVQTSEVFFSQPQRQAEWTLSRVELASGPASSTVEPTFKAVPLAKGVLVGEERQISVAGTLLEPGQRYLMTVQVSLQDPDLPDPVVGISEQPFRLLSRVEKNTLRDLERQALRRSKQEDSALPLLELATLMMEWDQMADAEQVLKKARSHSGWARLDTETTQKVERFQEVLNEIWDRPLPEEPKKSP